MESHISLSFSKKHDYCSIEHIQNIIAYCVTCQNYICETCQFEAHAEHEHKMLEAECLKIFSEAKKVQYETQAISKQYKARSIDAVIENLRNQISEKFDEIISQLHGLKEKRIKELINSEEVKNSINSSLLQDEYSLVMLREIQIDSEKLMEQIKSDFDNRRYISLFERNFSQELTLIRKRLEDWKKIMLNSPKPANIVINMQNIERKLCSLIGISYVSRPSPQFVYTFDNENNKLLLYDMQKRTTQIMDFGTHFHIPFHYSSAILDNKIYFAGGDDDGYRKDCYELSITKKYIQKLYDLNIERRNHGLCALNIARILYCVGGYNKRHGTLNSVEKYEFSRPRWVIVSSLNEKRQWPGVCQFNNRLIYAFGGSNSNSIEKLDILNEELGWQIVILNENKDYVWTGRFACAAVQVGVEEILIFGGCEQTDLDSAVLYNPVKEIIVKSDNLPIPSLFCQFSPAITPQHVGIIGWRNEEMYLYSIKKHKWETIEQDAYCPSDFVSR